MAAVFWSKGLLKIAIITIKMKIAWVKMQLLEAWLLKSYGNGGNKRPSNENCAFPKCKLWQIKSKAHWLISSATEWCK